MSMSCVVIGGSSPANEDELHRRIKKCREQFPKFSSHRDPCEESPTQTPSRQLDPAAASTKGPRTSSPGTSRRPAVARGSMKNRSDSGVGLVTSLARSRDAKTPLRQLQLLLTPPPAISTAAEVDESSDTHTVHETPNCPKCGSKGWHRGPRLDSLECRRVEAVLQRVRENPRSRVPPSCSRSMHSRFIRSPVGSQRPDVAAALVPLPISSFALTDEQPNARSPRGSSRATVRIRTRKWHSLEGRSSKKSLETPVSGLVQQVF